MKSKDLTLIIVMAVLQFVLSASIVQMGKLITGIRGSNYLFTIILAIPICLSLLMYEGRRWRFFVQMSIFTLLIIPTNLGGTPFDPVSRLGGFATAFLVDLIANSSYGIFWKHKKMFWWSIIICTLYWVLNPFFSTVVKFLFFPPEVMEAFLNVVLVLLPVIIIEAIAGGIIGHQIYRRLKKTKKI